MRSFPHSKLLFTALLSTLALSGCEDATEDVSVRFVGLVDGQPAACGQTYSGLGMTGTDYTLQDYRLYVHDVRLLTEDGREVPVALTQDGLWQREDVALLDFESGGAGCPSGTEGTNDRVVGTVAESGPFNGLRFTLGVPFELNHADVSVAEAPLSQSAMFWNWQGGYKFIRIDGTTTGLADGFLLHLGSTGCDGDSLTGGTTTCANPNRVHVELTGFDPTAGAVAVDVAEVFAGSDMDVNEGQPGCMSNPMDPECAPVFSRLGLPFGGSAAGEQGLFTIAVE